MNDDNITAEVVRTGKMQAIEGWDDRFERSVSKPELLEGQVSFFIPVKKEGQVLAVLATGSSIAEKQELLHRIEVMHPLLDQVAIALEHARLYEEAFDYIDAPIKRVAQKEVPLPYWIQTP